MCAAALVAFAVFADFALDRHRNFESTAYDLGFFDQIIWNTSQGRWFETTFTPYNFLGQHVQPVLLMFALAYRAGAGIEFVLVTQTAFVAAAALPLFYAARRATSNEAAALGLSLGFLLSAYLHRALDFDLHPELMGFFFVFLAAYYVVAGRPVAVIAALLPLLLLKEDMPLVLGGFGLILWWRGHRREGLVLEGIAAAWTVAVVLVLMPWIRGGSGDLTERYSYLVADTQWWSVAPVVVMRAAEQLWTEPAAAIARVMATSGFAALLTPYAVLASTPAYALASLSEHPQQSRLELHYSMAPLALTWVGALLSLERASRWRLGGVPLATVLSLLVVASSAVTFFAWSPYSPGEERYAPDAAHRAVLREALDAVPGGVAVSAQNTILPHLSRRERVDEFPDLGDAEYVIVDPSLPVTGQSRAAGYDEAVAGMTERGFELIFDRDGVQVFRRLQ